MKFNKWLDALIEKKGIDTEQIIFDGDNDNGVYNLMTLDVVIETIKGCSTGEQMRIKNQLIKIDFVNGDIVNFFKYLAKYLVNNY